MKNIFIIIAVIVTLLYINKGKENSIEKLEEGCNSGNVINCMQLAETVKPDYITSEKFYKIACNTHKYAAGCLGVQELYETNLLKDNNYMKTFEYSHKACDLNISMACVNLSMMYLGGQGTKENPIKAKEYYHKGCDNKTNKICKEYTDLYNEMGIEYSE